MTFLEVFSAFHGVLGTLFLMAFAGAAAELLELTHGGLRRLKLGTFLMAITSVFIFASGTFIYISYRAPGGPRADILAGSTPWVHTILFELKEFTGAFVPVLAIVAASMVFILGETLIQDRRYRMMLGAILLLIVIWTFLTYGLGAYVAKVAPLL